MPFYKYSFVMRYISGGTSGNWKYRPGGFSESVYWSTFSAQSVLSFGRLATARAALLPTRSAITGFRFQQVDPKGASSTRRVQYFGPTQDENKSDIPQMGLLMSIPAAAVTNVRRHRIAALPDSSITFGEYNPTGFIRFAMTAYLRELNGWLMKGIDLTQPQKLIKTISALGAYELNEALALAVGDVVNVRSAINSLGQAISGQFVVDTAPTTTTGTLRKWVGGACTLGKMRKVVNIYPAMVTTGLNQDDFDVITRKIGRPGQRYVGRQSKRRR